MPLHKGHEHLINTARAACEQLMILVVSHEGEPIPGWQRYAWVKNTWPELDVRHLVVPADNRPADQAGLLGQVGVGPDGTCTVYYGENQAAYWSEHPETSGACIPMWPQESPFLSSDIRNNPALFQTALSPLVRAFYILRVALVGPESCGKSYLAEALAAHFQTVFVEEYGRTYCEKYGMDLSELDFAHIAGGQLYREDEMAQQANQILFCDTDLMITQVWSEIYFQGRCQSWIMQADHERRYALYLLLAPDIPWVNDGLREYEAQRDWMFDRLKNELEARRLPHVIIRGNYEHRTRQAIEAVAKLLDR